MQFRKTFQPITFWGQSNQLKGSMLKITFQKFKDSVHSERVYQIPLTLQCEMMAPQGIVLLVLTVTSLFTDCGFLYGPVGWPAFCPTPRQLQSCVKLALYID